ncbi:hypothetical protein AHF37_10163 [Paragonimus kellicotti]|nr:hypothetical protein AHF37_10163 [Paragonimus kellicotti]
MHTHFALVKCNLKNEQLNGLEELRNLEVLDLSENELKHFTTDDNALPHLIALNLSENHICTLDQLTGPYPALRELDISSNFLMKIDRRSISNISPQLYTLNLSNNLITRMSHSGETSATPVCHPPFGRIDLTGNQLSHLDSSISTDYLATSFDFTSNLLQQLPSVGLHGPILKRLCFDQNYISSLDPLSQSWLPNLQLLSACQNRITEIPELFCPKLKHLLLGDNQISDWNSVNKSVRNLPTLKYLNIENNPCIVLLKPR